MQQYFVEVYRILRQLHNEANRKPNSVFVDHYAGEVDSRSGKPISSTNKPLTSVDEDEGSYSFYGELESVEQLLAGQRKRSSARIAPGTRIDTVEI